MRGDFQVSVRPLLVHFHRIRYKALRVLDLLYLAYKLGCKTGQ